MTDADLATNLRDLLGSKMVAYLGDVQETRAVREWASGDRRIASPFARERIRLALYAAMLITQRDAPGIAQAWFQGLNPALGDRSPLRALKDADDLDTEGAAVLSAAQQFAANVQQRCAQLIDPISDPAVIIETIRAAVNQLEHLDTAYIFGSWAARYHGVDGPPPSDIDVLLIGTVERRAASTMCADLSRRLGHEVNGYRISVAAWKAESPDALVRDVRSRPLILLLTDFEMAYRDSDARKVVEESRGSDVRSTWRPGPPGAAT